MNNIASAFIAVDFKEFVNNNFIWSRQTVGIYTVSFLFSTWYNPETFKFVEGNLPLHL